MEGISKKKKFTCQYCGKEYYSSKENSKYCSRECRKAANNFECNCEYCNKKIMVPKWKYQRKMDGKISHIYCSKECTDKAHTTKVTKTCEQCGREFTVYNCFKDNQRFCSRKCYDENRKKKHICPVCGKEFKPEYQYQIYCSQNCKESVGCGSTTVFCDYCGKPITRNNYEIYSHQKHYCSAECKANDLYWNVQDLDVLREYFGKADIKEIQPKLSKERSLSEITRKAHKIGLATDTSWSNEEDQLLIGNYENIPMAEICKLFPNRTPNAIRSHAKLLGLTSYFVKNRTYTDDEVIFLRENYTTKPNRELANILGRSEFGIAGKLRELELVRSTEIKKDGYYDLVKFTRSKLSSWREDVLKSYNYTCYLTGSTEHLVAHHIRGFNLLFEETVETLDFPLYDNFAQYTDKQLYLFVDTFLDIQEYYHAYVCISEDIHILFHRAYGYGYNTQEQWNEFVKRYKSGYYDEVA